MGQGTLFIISAPSGAGKTSLIEQVLKRINKVQLSVSHTTRSPRPGEVDGINYHFVKEREFEQMRDNYDFLEHAEVHGNLYGTSRIWVEKTLASGIDVILEIDWQGANQIRKIFQNCCSIFVLPPSRQELRSRIVNRGKDGQEIIERRMAAAQAEMSHWKDADFIIINDDFEAACDTLTSVLTKEMKNKFTNTTNSDFDLLISDLLW